MGNKRYTGNWNSVNTHTVPKWYEDCKFGIFIHWGIYSVPAFAPHTWELGEVDSKEWFADNPYAEWYYNSLNIGKGPTYEHHMEKYGKDFKYEDFIPMWKAENWDPKQWAEIFKEAGAEYVVLTTKHHDGFMYVYLLLSILGSFLQTIRITLLPIVRGEKEKVM